MKYLGQVKNGVIVPDRPTRLPDGTVFTIEPVRASTGRNGDHRRRSKMPRPGTMGALLQEAGSWVGEPGEMNALLDHLRQMKRAEVAARSAAIRPPSSPTNRRSAGKRKRGT